MPYGFHRPRMRGASSPMPAAPAITLPSKLLWFDFSDASTLFTDTAGTTVVTADAQTIARINNKGSASMHLTGSATYKTNIKNGLSISRWNGTSHKFTSSANVNWDAGTTFIVAKIDTPGGYSYFYTHADSGSSAGHNFVWNAFMSEPSSRVPGSDITGNQMNLGRESSSGTSHGLRPVFF